MSFWDCVNDAIDEGSADRERGQRAQQMWRDLSDRYERQGYSRENAEAMAGEDVKEAFRKEAGENRHVFLSQIANQRRLQAATEEAAKSGDLARFQTRSVERMDYEARGLVRRFNGKLSAFLKQHHRDLLGNVTDKAGMKNILRELHGESTGDAAAMALAHAVRDALEDMRLSFNEAGGLIGQRENYGVPHSHNRRAVSKAGFDRWFADTQDAIDWNKIEDPLTGRPLAEPGEEPPMETQRRFLREVYDNIVFGSEAAEAIYGRQQGEALYRRRSKSRVLHFRNADAWIAYNREYGTGDPFNSLMSHVHRMARDIAAMRAFGPNPRLGVDFQQQLAQAKARVLGDARLAEKARGNGNHAARMLRVTRGNVGPETLAQEFSATFFSTTRHVLTAAFLDRAIIASIADTNTMRLAAQAIGMNPENVFSRHVTLMAEALKGEGATVQDALRAGWIADTLADPGVALARFQQEVPPAEFAERLSSAALRVQGLSGWTDHARIAFQMEMAGLFARNAGKPISDVDEPLRKLLAGHGVTEAEWKAFTAPETLFTAANGATFASPIYWREATDLPRVEADGIFGKMQGILEEQTEYAVPTQSLLARGALDPAAYGLPAGSILYEFAKSGLMFKSFAMTFTVNQYRRIMEIPTYGGRMVYATQLAGGAALMGAVALQLGEIIKGNDPLNMTEPEFWARAAMKGGSFGILGDVAAAGQQSWGAGLADYIAGPVVQLGQDAWGLTMSNGLALAMGKDPHFASDLVRAGKRYMPMGQTPLVGPALDRLFWDQLHILLDPDAYDAMMRKAKRRDSLPGGQWWMPGSPMPDRAPDFKGILGGVASGKS